MKRPRKRLRMFSLLRASINIHYNVSLSERINSFHLQLPEIASAKVTRARRVSNSAKVGLARLAVRQRQNGSHSEREPCQNEYDSAGWRRHGKKPVADESEKANVASKLCESKHPPTKQTEHQRPQQQTLL